MFFFLIFLGCTGKGTDSTPESASDSDATCIAEGDEFDARTLDTECCSGLVGASLEDIPRDDYTQDDYPKGCGPAEGVPPSLLVCIACGDGVCGLDEHYCNCAEDCAQGEVGPTR